MCAFVSVEGLLEGRGGPVALPLVQEARERGDMAATPSGSAPRQAGLLLIDFLPCACVWCVSVSVCEYVCVCVCARYSIIN